MRGATAGCTSSNVADPGGRDSKYLLELPRSVTVRAQDITISEERIAADIQNGGSKLMLAYRMTPS